MGDHFVLLVDRLLTESTLEAAIESRSVTNWTGGNLGLYGRCDRDSFSEEEFHWWVIVIKEIGGVPNCMHALQSEYQMLHNSQPSLKIFQKLYACMFIVCVLVQELFERAWLQESGSHSTSTFEAVLKTGRNW